MTPQEIEQIINMLVEKLGPIGGQVWSIYVRQVYIQTIWWVVIGLILVVVGIVGIALGYKGRKQRQEIVTKRKGDRYDHYGDTTPANMAMGFGWGLGGVSVVMGVLALLEITRLLNPEYYAIQMLLGR